MVAHKLELDGRCFTCGVKFAVTDAPNPCVICTELSACREGTIAEKQEALRRAAARLLLDMAAGCPCSLHAAEHQRLAEKFSEHWKELET